MWREDTQELGDELELELVVIDWNPKILNWIYSFQALVPEFGFQATIYFTPSYTHTHSLTGSYITI
jgi:hypothetical protein